MTRPSDIQNQIQQSLNTPPQPQQIFQSSPQQGVNLDTDVYGMFEVVSAVPSGVPKTAYDQIKIYTNSTTFRLYWYDWQNHAWHYVTATA